MQILSGILVVLLILTSLVLIAVVLLQPGKSAGMSGAISGGAETFFGKNKAKSYEGKLLLITKISAACLFVLALALSIIDRLI